MSDIIKDTQKDVSNKLSNTIGSFHQFKNFFINDSHKFIVRKTERLASALYIITGFIPQNEPVRTHLRERALGLIALSSHPSEFGDTGIKKFEADCAEIGAILETAQSGGLVSHMNAKLICEEYALLAAYLQEHAEKISKHQGEISAQGLSDPDSQGHQKGHYAYSPLDKNKSQKVYYNLSAQKKQSDRKSLILNLFKNKDKISIKDAVSSIQGYSEKTVQRELLSLVRSGILIKEGERRWSTYKKADTGVAGPIPV